LYHLKIRQKVRPISYLSKKQITQPSSNNNYLYVYSKISIEYSLLVKNITSSELYFVKEFGFESQLDNKEPSIIHCLNSST